MQTMWFYSGLVSTTVSETTTQRLTSENLIFYIREVQMLTLECASRVTGSRTGAMPCPALPCHACHAFPSLSHLPEPMLPCAQH